MTKRKLEIDEDSETSRSKRSKLEQDDSTSLQPMEVALPAPQSTILNTDADLRQLLASYPKPLYDAVSQLQKSYLIYLNHSRGEVTYFNMSELARILLNHKEMLENLFKDSGDWARRVQHNVALQFQILVHRNTSSTNKAIRDGLVVLTKFTTNLNVLSDYEKRVVSAPCGSVKIPVAWRDKVAATIAPQDSSEKILVEKNEESRVPKVEDPFLLEQVSIQKAWLEVRRSPCWDDNYEFNDRMAQQQRVREDSQFLNWCCEVLANIQNLPYMPPSAVELVSGIMAIRLANRPSENFFSIVAPEYERNQAVYDFSVKLFYFLVKVAAEWNASQARLQEEISKCIEKHRLQIATGDSTILQDTFSELDPSSSSTGSSIEERRYLACLKQFLPSVHSCIVDLDRHYRRLIKKETTIDYSSTKNIEHTLRLIGLHAKRFELFFSLSSQEAQGIQRKFTLQFFVILYRNSRLNKIVHMLPCLKLDSISLTSLPDAEKEQIILYAKKGRVHMSWLEKVRAELPEFHSREPTQGPVANIGFFGAPEVLPIPTPGPFVESNGPI